MRPEMNPLDLNNLPEEYLREGKQILEGSSTLHIEASDTTRGCRKKKSGGKNECGKVYECRFCSLKFCKSQALGGHMNRHRQERETETLNRARQLVFSNDNLVPQGGPHLGFRDPNLGTVQAIQPGNVNQSGNIGDPSLPFRSVYPTRMFSGSPSTINISQSSTPNQTYHYTSPSSRLSSFPSHYPPQMENDYFVSSHRHPNPNYTTESNYTCIGAPLGRDFQPVHGAVRGTDLSSVSGTSEDRLLQNQDDGVNWGRNYGGSQRINPSSINRFHGGY